MSPADPYRKHRFRLRLGRDPAGRVVAGFNRASVPAAAPAVGPANDLTFERGLTCDAEFEGWCTATPVQRDLVIEMLDLTGDVAQAFLAVNCVVTRYVGLADLDRDVNALAIEALSLQATSVTPFPQ
jgi:hypothetical protein